MFRPSGTIVLPFWIKKASLALRMESRLEEIFSIGISCMSLAVWLVEDRKCSAAVVGLDLALGLSNRSILINSLLNLWSCDKLCQRI